MKIFWVFACVILGTRFTQGILFRRYVSQWARSPTAFSRRQLAVSLNSTRILGGRPSRVGETPYQLSLKRKGVHGCGAVLTEIPIVQHPLILTAAHCLVDETTGERIAPHELTVAGGSLVRNDKEWPNQELAVSRYVIHPNFTVDPFVKHDIAMIFVYGRFHQNVVLWRIPFPTHIYYSGTHLKISGWGFTSRDPTPEYADTLQVAHIRQVSLPKCREEWKPYGVNILDTMICTSNELSAPCVGDSGSPLIGNLMGNNNFSVKRHLFLVGISSFAMGVCAEANVSAVATLVTPYSGWMLQQVVRHEALKVIPRPVKYILGLQYL